MDTEIILGKKVKVKEGIGTVKNIEIRKSSCGSYISQVTYTVELLNKTILCHKTDILEVLEWF